MVYFLDCAFEFINRLGIHIPDEVDRDVRSKLSIRRSEHSKCGPNKKYTRWTRIYQCLCGTDHAEGRFSTAKRQIGWENVACTMYAKVITTHDENHVNGARLEHFTK